MESCPFLQSKVVPLLFTFKHDFMILFSAPARQTRPQLRILSEARGGISFKPYGPYGAGAPGPLVLRGLRALRALPSYV